MKKVNTSLLDDDIFMKLICKEDIESYYSIGFEQPDPIVNYLTGTTKSFTKEQIIAYVHRIIDDDTRYDFLIRNKDNQLLGEIVLNEIDWDTKIGGFRIALFSSQFTNAGIGKRTIKKLLQFAFETLQLHRIELEVFDFNDRAKHVYESCGFQEEGRKRDALYLEGSYHDVFIMGILAQDYQRVYKG